MQWSYNSDILAGTLGLRYGLTGKAEIYTRTSYVYADSRTNNSSGISHKSNNHFVDAWLGVNYQFKKDDATPALLGFAELALAEKHLQQNSYLRSILFGLTTYKALDPIVLSLTMAYRLNQRRQDGSSFYKPGDLLLLNPSIAFAVNERVTLTSGVQWTNRQADKFNDVLQGYRQTATDLLLGVGYGFEKNSTLNFTLKANVSGRSGADACG